MSILAPGASAFVLGVQWELHEEWRADEAMFGIWKARGVPINVNYRYVEAELAYQVATPGI